MAEALSIRTAKGRSAFRQMYMDGLTQAEIAKSFGVDVGNVYNWARDLQMEKLRPGRKPGNGGRPKGSHNNPFYDPPEVISACLNCKRDYCPGKCNKITGAD